MSEELSMKDLQMKGLTEKIEMMLKGLDKSKRQELDLAEIGSRLRDFQTALDGAQLELKHLGANVQKAEFTKQLRDHKHTLKELKNEYEWRKSNSDKNNLLDGASAGATAADMTTAEGMMKHGLDVQDKSKESLERTRRVVAEAKDIGIDTVAKLDANTQQIEKMYDNLTSIDTTLARSTKVIKRMARKMATDKVIWVFAFLVFAAIIFIIVYKKLKPNSSLETSVDSSIAQLPNSGGGTTTGTTTGT
jgi:hypothetical protein